MATRGKTESFQFLNVCTTFATGDKSNLHRRGIFDTLSKKKSCLKGGERKLLIFILGSRTREKKRETSVCIYEIEKVRD